MIVGQIIGLDMMVSAVLYSITVISKILSIRLNIIDMGNRIIVAKFVEHDPNLSDSSVYKVVSILCI